MSRYYILLLLFYFGLISCDKVNPIELDQEEPELVVVSNFTKGKDIRVIVSKSRSITDQSMPEYLLDATVELYRGAEYLETLELIDPKGQEGQVPFYTSYTFQPEVNIVYHLKASAPGFRSVTSQSRIPEQINLLSIDLDDVVQEELNSGQIEVEFELNLNFEDPVQEINYYHISLMQQYHHYMLTEDGDTSIIDTEVEPIRLGKQNNSNTEVAHVGGGMLLTDEPFDGKIISYNIPISLQYNPAEELLGKIFVDLRAVSEEYYRYFEALSRQEDATDSPFEDPVFLFDNIEGGKGVFAGYNSSLDSLQLSN